MRSRQRELRSGGMIENRPQPRRRAVTYGAILGKTGRPMGRICRRTIIRQMAGRALCRRPCIRAILMAENTLRSSMRSGQYKSG